MDDPTPAEPPERVRTLPLVPRPFPNETLESYFAELAAANRCYVRDLARYLGVRPRQGLSSLDLGRLAGAVGRPIHSLLRAFPELREGPSGRLQLGRTRSWPINYFPNPRPACKDCSAGRDRTGEILHWVAAHRIICVQHDRWLGDRYYAETDHLQPRLRGCPEIGRANQRHRKLVRKHGLSQVARGTRSAVGIISDWTRWSFVQRFGRRLDALGTHEDDALWVDDPRCEAARYPEIVSLTAILASPYWCRVALSVNPTAGLSDLFNEVSRCVNVNDRERSGLTGSVWRWVTELRKLRVVA